MMEVLRRELVDVRSGRSMITDQVCGEVAVSKVVPEGIVQIDSSETGEGKKLNGDLQSTLEILKQMVQDQQQQPQRTSMIAHVETYESDNERKISMLERRLAQLETLLHRQIEVNKALSDRVVKLEQGQRSTEGFQPLTQTQSQPSYTTSRHSDPLTHNRTDSHPYESANQQSSPPPGE